MEHYVFNLGKREVSKDRERERERDCDKVSERERENYLFFLDTKRKVIQAK